MHFISVKRQNDFLVLEHEQLVDYVVYNMSCNRCYGQRNDTARGGNARDGTDGIPYMAGDSR
jgi:hypothetical protein